MRTNMDIDVIYAERYTTEWRSTRSPTPCRHLWRLCCRARLLSHLNLHHPNPTPSIRLPGKFPRQFWPPAFFVCNYKTLEYLSFRNRQMSLKRQKCLRELTRMASKWHIDGVFSDIRIEKRGYVFWLISVLWLYCEWWRKSAWNVFIWS